jgi:hypothetical protein
MNRARAPVLALRFLALGDLAAAPNLSARDQALSPDLTSLDLTIPLLSELTIPTAQSEAIAISSGADGNLWFAEYGASKIGRITLEGVITEFPLERYSEPEGIAAGADGNIWFPESGRSRVGRITPSGQVIRVTTAGVAPAFALGGVSLLSIAAGPDGRLWIVDCYGSLQSMNVDGTPGPPIRSTTPQRRWRPAPTRCGSPTRTTPSNGTCRLRRGAAFRTLG